MVTVIDTAARPPTPDTIKGAGHKGQVVYISPDRTNGGLPGKPVTRAHVDAMRAAGLSVGVVWQYGKDTTDAPPDVMRGADGGRADARAAEAKLRELGLNDWPVFFAVDFDITTTQWNTTAVHYFRAAAEILGKHRVGIYGHSRVCHWAGPEDKAIGEVAPGRYLAWQTKSWSGGVVARDYGVLYQRIVDTRDAPGPLVGGVRVDVSDTLFEYWGQGPNGYRSAADLAAGELTPKELEKYLKVQPDEVRLMNKHFTPGRGGQKIEFIVRHHLAGVGTTKDVWNWWQVRKASAHYVVEPSTRIGQLVWDRDTAWASLDANSRSIAIEHSNSDGAAADYPIAAEVIISGARWAAALCLFYGLGRPEFGKNIRDHREFGATSCPHHLANGGKYHQQWMDEAQAFYDVLVAAKAGNITAPQPPPPAPPVPAQTEEVIMPDHVQSLINPDVRLSLPHYRELQDAYAWRAEVLLRGLYAALGLDPDEVLAAALAADHARTIDAA
ncbi:glycoside hydrolase domain-containing protein [Corynebacterium xerosis]|nr:glycoside hydrolase domain-containing protein [Corynebacterium xerosis]